MIDSPKEYLPEYILSALHIESYEPSSSQYTKIGMMHNSIVGHSNQKKRKIVKKWTE